MFLIPALFLGFDAADGPGAAADPAADIAGFYAWHTDDGDLVVVLTFAASTATATYDADVLYGVHFDTDGDHAADKDIYVRYGQDPAGQWGVQVEGVNSEPVVGPVETTLTEGDVQVWTGAADDPFFVDLDGLQETMTTGALSLDSTRDARAGLNVTAVVLSFPRDGFVGADGTTSAWATTGRK